jgi:hypothetical protein
MQIEMTIKGLMVDPITNTPIVILRDKEGQRVLPIWVGIFEANADGSRTVHWSMAVLQPGQRPFTTFAHQPHISLVADKQCQTCHMTPTGKMTNFPVPARRP